MVTVGDTGTIPYGMAASFLGAHSYSRPDAGDGCVNKMREDGDDAHYWGISGELQMRRYWGITDDNR